MTEPLRLQARDAEDVRVISAMMQDAAVPVSEMSYDPVAGCFMFAASRFRWENAEAAAALAQPVYEWINSVLRVEGVRAVQCHRFDWHDRRKICELLALLPEDRRLTLAFAGEAEVRLDLGDWTVRLEDFGAPWPTTQRPRHGGLDTP